MVGNRDKNEFLYGFVWFLYGLYGFIWIGNRDNNGIMRRTA